MTKMFYDEDEITDETKDKLVMYYHENINEFNKYINKYMNGYKYIW